MRNVQRIINFSGSRTYVGMICRYKRGVDHDPSALDTHADCITSNGSPVGFFGGTGIQYVSSNSGDGGGLSGSGASVGLGLHGLVFYHDDFIANGRKHYVDINEAQKHDAPSTAILIEVDKPTANIFDEYWEAGRAMPKSYWLIGANCATRASDAFMHAGILDRSIPWLDTPNNLFKQLRKKYPSAPVISKYIGFQKVGLGYDLIVKA